MTDARPFGRAALALVFVAALGGCGDAGEDAAEETGMEQPAAAVDTGADVSADAAMDGDALIDPNEADREELMALPGMDSATVALVLERRPFTGMLALDSALGGRMDSTALDALYREMFIPLDLDSAPREEILLIPGVGPRMAAEFLEYRPYEGGMAEFRQEIGKYVDEAEVARLERYVTIR